MRSSGAQRGFVLPAVLAYVAAFMLIVVLAAGSLQRARSTALDIGAQGALQSALDDIEAQALYLYLTSVPVPGGAEVFRAPGDATAIVMGGTDENGDPVAAGVPGRMWSAADGSLWLQSGRVTGRAQYRDVGGLVSLNSSGSQIIAGLLRQFGVSGDDAAGLAATLGDFIDEDSVRRPRGAEAADYRLRQRPVPTNSPLRDLAELQRVLGWEDLEFTGDLAFISAVTVALTAPEPRWVFSPPVVAGLEAGLDETWRRDLDPLAVAASGHTVPGAQARLTLTAFDPVSGSGRMRIVEVERMNAGLTAPYTRRLIHETAYTLMQGNQPADDLNLVDPFQEGDTDG